MKFSIRDLFLVTVIVAVAFETSCQRTPAKPIQVVLSNEQRQVCESLLSHIRTKEVTGTDRLAVSRDMFAADFSDEWMLSELSRCSMSIDNDIAQTVKSESRLEDGDLTIAEGERLVDDDDSNLIGDTTLVRVVLAVPYVNADRTKAVSVARIRSRQPGLEHLYTLAKRSDKWTVVDDVLTAGE